MATNYLSHFKLKDDPFRITPDITYFYNSPEHSTALLSLEYCMKEKEGFCILTGEPGTGKTTILRLFVEKWKTHAEIALIMTPRLAPEEFFTAVLEDFKIPLNSHNKNDMLKAFRDFLLSHADKNKRVAIIVDEAQELPDTTLEELRLLSNLETEKEKLLQIFLVGQPELKNKLQGAALRQLNSRITVRIELKPLTETETSDYITNRLFQAGSMSPIFNLKAKKLIFALSGGVPRTINLLASRGLMSAFLEGTGEVFERHIEQGATDLMGTPVATDDTHRKHGSRKGTILKIFMLLLLIVGGLFFYLNSSTYMKQNVSVPLSAQPATVQTAPPVPVTAQVSSASSAKSSLFNESGQADTNKSAFIAFNAIAKTWNLAPITPYENPNTDPWSYLALLSSRVGMELIQYSGTLDALLEIGYPAILQINHPNNGAEIYYALIKNLGEELVVATGETENKNISKKELGNIWRGKAFILWKNYKRIPSQIPVGSKTKETEILQKLLMQAGISAGQGKEFDQKMVDAINKFQKTKGLRISGQPDPQTLLYLYKSSTSVFYHPTLK